MNHSSKYGKMIISFILIAIIYILAFHSLWNWLMPKIFNLPVITIYESIGLIILSKLIFGCSFFKKHCSHQKNKCSNYDKELTEDEKESFKNKFKNNCFK